MIRHTVRAASRALPLAALFLGVRQVDAQPLREETITLGALLKTAAREALSVRVAAANVRQGEGALLRAGRAVDPTLAFGSGVASDLFGGSQRAAVSSAVSATMGSMWGTDLQVTYQRQDGSGFDPLRQLAAPSTFSVSMSQSLLDGRNERSGSWRASVRERSALEFERQRNTQRVLASVEMQYWALAEAEAVELVRMASADLVDRLLNRSREMVRLELAPEADLLAVQSRLAARKAAVAEARQERLDQSDALVFATYGERATSLVARGVVLRTADAAEPTSNGARLSVSTDSMDAALLTRRPDVMAARERRDAATTRSALAHSSLRPSMQLEGGWATVNNVGTLGASTTRTGSVQGWRAGISMSAPLLNRDDRGRALMMDAEREAEELRVSDAENAARLEVRVARRAMALAAERLALLDDASHLAGRQLAAEQQRQTLGLSDTFRLLEVEEYRVEAQLAAVRARFELRRAEARLVLALGTEVSPQ